MKAVEAVKEKFYCFLGNVHPTYYQSRGWGPWLDPHTPCFGLMEVWWGFPKDTCIILLLWRKMDVDVGVRLRLGERKKMEDNENEAGVHCGSSGCVPLYFDPEV